MSSWFVMASLGLFQMDGGFGRERSSTAVTWFWNLASHRKKIGPMTLLCQIEKNWAAKPLPLLLFSPRV
jgi:hypothetical protein